MTKQKSRLPAAVTAVLRTIFILAFGVTGFVLGREVDLQLIAPHLESSLWQGISKLALPVAGALLGVALSPLAQGVFEDELEVIETASERLAPLEIIGGTTGLCIGLLIALLLRALFASLIAAVGVTADALLVLAAVIFGAFCTYGGFRVGGRAARDHERTGGEGLLLDTSAIIDGRIVDVVRAGFIIGKFLVPRFVLSELQNIADSADPQRRTRGRRGLELLDALKSLVAVEIYGDSRDDGTAVDARLVQIAREQKLRLVTTDYNLNRVARLEGVLVMNVNELAHALRPALVAGQIFDVVVTREGREADQGVGYLDDGTMIVVEGGRTSVGEAVSVVVTSVLQTAAGRMVFARKQ